MHNLIMGKRQYKILGEREHTEGKLIMVVFSKNGILRWEAGPYLLYTSGDLRIYDLPEGQGTTAAGKRITCIDDGIVRFVFIKQELR